MELVKSVIQSGSGNVAVAQAPAIAASDSEKRSGCCAIL